MKEFIPDHRPYGDPKKEIAILQQQVMVGTILKENPALIEFIKFQTEVLISDMSQIISGDADKVKDRTLMCTHQIAVYKFLYELASNHEENEITLQQLTTNSN